MSSFTNYLKRESSEGVTNPWYEWDKDFDASAESPAIRRRQLARYLSMRKGARFLLLGEALGFQGGRFTGIAMTSERIILGKLADRGILPRHVLGETPGVRTSRTDAKLDGYTEPTASIVWPQVIDSRIDTSDIIFWNAFPWHPYDPRGGPLTNRKPSRQEVEEGGRVLDVLLRQHSIATVIAMGKTAKGILEEAGIPATEVRHPARGGATEFRRQFSAILSDT
jgi:hypothetical protein